MENKELFELTNPQKSIWYTEQFYEGTTVNNICVSGTLYGNINEDLLKQAINNVVEQNDSFRIHVVLNDNIVKQYISKFKKFSIDVEYINDESEIKQIESEEAKYKFDVIDSDLFRFKIAMSKNNFASIILTVNHLIADSWSLGLVIQEIIKNYNSLKNNEEFTPDTFSYLDYVNSENEYRNSSKFENDKTFWNQIFNTIPEQATIPCLINGAKNVSYNAKRLGFEIDKDLLYKINNFCRENHISTFNFFMAIFSIYIGRVSNIDDFVIGTPILNRSNFKEKHTTGMFVNTVPVRFNNINDGTFKSLADDVAKKMLGILRHQKYSYNSILSDLRSKYDNIPNLYNIAISYQITKAFNGDLGNYKTNWTFNNFCANDFNIHIHDINDTGNLIINYDYLVDKYSENDVTNTHNRIINMINQVLDNNDINICNIEIITPDEKDKILNVFNDTKSDYPNDKTITDVFEEQVQKYPDSPAVICNGKTINYKEFNEKANQLARYLKDQGVKAHDNVIILLDKDIDLYVSIIAILKLGALYVPIDCKYPKSRIDTIIEDCKPKTIIVSNKYTDLIDYNNTCIFPLSNLDNYEKTNIKNSITSNDGAYIIYTSGSTGKPKGVVVPHRGVVRLVINTNYITFEKTDRILQNIAVVFDASVFAIFGALLNGLPLYPVSKDQLLDFEYLEKFIKDNKISIVNLTVSLFNKLIDYNPKFFDTTRVILIGGETVIPKYVNTFKDNCPNTEIINVYGPTENSDLSCCHIIDENYESSVPIGKPVSNSTCYILDKNLNLQPVGVPGEIYVGGDGVALGYLNRDDLTAKSFIPNKFGAGKLYKTGDFGYWENEGIVQFISRIDNQVKIRGYRIELKEIQSKILEYGKIKECSVIVAENNSSKFIVACIGTKDDINLQDLTAYLKSSLPFYMIPSKYIVLDSLPLNINGKLDTKKLLTYVSNMPVQEEILKPTNNIEASLVEIWEKVLKIDNIGIDQNFFELGGDSLCAINLIYLINLKFNVKITIQTLFDHPTIQEIAALITENNTSSKNENCAKNISNGYSDINNLLKNNTLDNFEPPKIQKIGNLLLFGSTGFLGIHILTNYLDNDTGIAYCIIRPKNGKSPKSRLLDKLHFYFGTKYDSLFEKRIHILKGDIVMDNFGLSNNDYSLLDNNVDTVINCAAIVKHFGKRQNFENINIKGTSNIIKFCQNSNKRLLHCSTLSLTMDLSKHPELNSHMLSDQDFYFEQNLDNLYVSTKFEAERLVYEAISKGLNACCLRIGNISNRYSDGVFQENFKENSILMKLESFVEIGYIPDYLLDLTLDFTPVDLCSDAILKIAHTDIKYSTFHIFNKNIITMKNLIEIFNKLSINIKAIDETSFNKIFEEIRQDVSKQNMLTGIIQDWIKDKEFKYYYNNKNDSRFTEKYLNSIDFFWPELDIKYFEKCINHFKKLGYFGG